MNRLHLDYETRCDLDIKVVGAHRYFSHPSFEVLLTAWAWGDDEVEQVEGFWCPPAASVIHAFNAPFEMGVIRRVAGTAAAEKHQWRCTMAHAYARGFAKRLSDVGGQIGLPWDKVKMDRGSRLITKFCKPRKPSKSNPDRYWTPETAPGAWAEFKLYNRQDVVAEREVWRVLKAQGPWTREEQDLWMLDRKINARGVPVDLDRVNTATDMAERLTQAAGQEMRELIGIWPSEVAQLLEWAQGQGYPFTTLAKGTVEEWLQDHPEGLLARVLRLRLDFAQSATKKFNAIRDRNHEGRMFDTMQFCGASRTGRWAGRGLQLQNLKRPTIKDPSAAADFLVEDPDGFEMFYDLEVLGSLIRSAIKAGPGKLLVVSDLSSIEMVVLAWMTKDPALVRIFRDGKDPYKVFAEMWLGALYNEVEKATRNLCKPPMLGCGYGLGGPGLVRYSESLGVEMDEDTALSAVRAYRTKFPAVPVFWRNIESAFRWAVRSPGTVFGQNIGFPMRYNGRMLVLRLPSGRCLYYDRPEVDEDGDLSYMGQNQFTGQWDRIRTWGGKLTENVDQAIARDLLAHALRLYDDAGGCLVGHVHDEMIAEEDKAEAEQWLETMNRCFTTAPDWFQGIPLKAEGYVARDYRKG
jgi:DNA polymerase